MKKSAISLSLVLCLLLAACGAPAAPTAAPAEDQTMHIVATTYPVYLFTTAVTQGMDGIEVTQLVNQQTACLHDYTLTVNDMKAIEKADVIVMNGAGLEDFMDDALASSGAPVVDCSQGIDLLPVQGHEGHDHDAEFDPHIWMSPANAAQMIRNIRTDLTQLLPDQEQLLADNADQAEARLTDELPALPSELAHRDLITFHDGFQYFSRAFDFTLLKAIEEEEGAETSAAEIKELVSLVGEKHIPAIFTEKNGSDATAKAIARETGCGVFQLDMIMSGSGTGIGPYIDGINANIDAIAEAFQ